MPVMLLPISASRKRAKSSHVALWAVLLAVIVVTGSGMILAGKIGRERRREVKRKIEK